MAKKTMAFGKGLSAMLEDAAAVQFNRPQAAPVKDNPEASAAAVAEIPLDKIIPNPYQPRLTFDEDALQELSDSIKVLGIIQPLTLRLMPDGRYQIISGERRYRASLAAGLKSVPAYVRKADDGAMLEMAIVENIQRENLDAIETALGFQRLIDECELTQEAMAIRVGKKRATVTNYLRLLKLPPEIQKAIKTGSISAGHAKALLGIEDGKLQVKLCEQTVANDWSVRQLEDRIRRISAEAGAKKQAAPLSEGLLKASDMVGRFFDGKVAIKSNGKGGGTMTVKFKNAAQMEKFIAALNNER